MRNGHIVNTLTSVDIQKLVKFGGKVIEFNEGVIYQENDKVSPFKKMVDKLFEMRQKNIKKKKNDIVQLLGKLIMNSLYREQIRKDIEENDECNLEAWMMTEVDEIVLECQKINHGNYIVKIIDDAGLKDEVKKVNTLPLQLGAFVLSNSK